MKLKEVGIAVGDCRVGRLMNIVLTFFKSLKAKLIWQQSWPTRRQTETAIF